MSLTTHISNSDKTETPYQLDLAQTLRATQALLKHIQGQVQKLQNESKKPNLLANDDNDDEKEDAEPIWLNITTKKYIADKARLKPSKIFVPHPLNTSENLTICLITTDPQRAVKNVVVDLPKALSSRITRVIGITKLAQRYKSFEQRRQLRSEHDIFLADDRIISRLPQMLGKVFYKGTSKRPIPISIAPPKDSKEKIKQKPAKDERHAEVASAVVVQREIEKALHCVPVSISPGYNITARIGLDSFGPTQVQDNVSAVTSAVIEKHVTDGWRNVKAIYIKSPTSMAIPIWLADDLQQTTTVEGPDDLSKPSGKSTKSRQSEKRKRSMAASSELPSGERKKARLLEERHKDKQEAVLRKTRLAEQKSVVLAAEA